MPNSSDLSQGAAERAGYIHGLPESTQADFLSGRMGFAMGFDNTNQIWWTCGARASSPGTVSSTHLTLPTICRV